MEQVEFRNQFKLPFGDFTAPVDFVDGGLGFSVFRKYPNEYASLFKIYLRKEEISKKEPLKSIEASVSYGKETQGGIILSSSAEKIKGLLDPIDLISRDDFSYDISTKKFFYEDKEIAANAILQILDKWHRKPTTFRGLWLVLKLSFFHYLLAGSLKIVFKVISGFHYLVSGEKVKIFHDLVDPRDSFKPDFDQPIQTKESELIDLWGYKVKPWIAGTYAGLHLFGYFMFYFSNSRPLWLVTIFKNSFLTFMYGIVSLGLANSFLPILLRPVRFKNILILIQSLYLKALSRRVKI